MDRVDLGCLLCFDETDWKVSLAAFQRKASHRPRSRLAAAGHLLLAAGRRGPAVVRHQPRRGPLPGCRRLLRRQGRWPAEKRGAGPPVRHRAGRRPGRGQSHRLRRRTRRAASCPPTCASGSPPPACRCPTATLPIKADDKAKAPARNGRFKAEGRRRRPRLLPHARRPAALRLQDHHARRQGRSRRDLGRST